MSPLGLWFSLGPWNKTKYSLQKQRDIIITCTVFHNFIKLFSDEGTIFNPEDDVADDDDGEDNVGDVSTQQQTEENNYMGRFRDQLANLIWNGKHEY